MAVSPFHELLVSCPNNRGGLFLVVDGSAIRVDDQPCTGLAVREGCLVRGLQQAGRVEIRAMGAPVRAVECAAVHDVRYHGSDLYAVSSLYNHVICVPESGKPSVVLQLPGERDSAHLNCLGSWQGALVYSAFGDFTEHRAYKERSAGAGFVAALRSGRRIVSGLTQPHNPVGLGRTLLVANSHERELREYDRFGTLVRCLAFNGFVRGILARAGIIYVGLSKSRHQDDAARWHAELVAIRASDWSELGRMDVPADEVYDIRSLRPGTPEGGIVLGIACEYLSRREPSGPESVLFDQLRHAIAARDTALSGGGRPMRRLLRALAACLPDLPDRATTMRP